MLHNVIDWKRACVVAGTPREKRRSLERVGRKRGADPRHWFACAVAVPLPDLTFQVFVGEWGAADPGEMAKVWTTTRERGAEQVTRQPQA